LLPGQSPPAPVPVKAAALCSNSISCFPADGRLYRTDVSGIQRPEPAVNSYVYKKRRAGWLRLRVPR
jgi:hypothetical protein